MSFNIPIIKYLFASIIPLLFVWSLPGQTISRTSIIHTIQYIHKHPFDSTNIIKINDLQNAFQRINNNAKYDHAIKVSFDMRINPSLKDLFFQTYVMGKVLWLCAKDTDQIAATIAGVKEMTHLYRKIKQKNRDFIIPFLEGWNQQEEDGKLDKNLRISLNSSGGEPYIALLPFIKGIAASDYYGQQPEDPIKSSFDCEMGYLSRLRCTDNYNRVHYHLINKATYANLLTRITGTPALLDIYKITNCQPDQPVYLYLDCYHRDTLYCPQGLDYDNYTY